MLLGRWAPRREREQRGLWLAAVTLVEDADPWDATLDAVPARQVLDGMAPQHRAVLTLRYLDGLPVGAVADHVGRTVHATEALLVRARAAFRAAYPSEEGRDD